MDSFLSTDPLYHVASLREAATDHFRQQIKQSNFDNLLPNYTPILMALEKNGQLTFNELVAITLKPKSTVSDMMKKLEKLGYIKRRVSSDDQRIAHITLTEKSKLMLPELSRIVGEVKDKMYLGFTEEEQAIFIKLLSKSVKNVT